MRRHDDALPVYGLGGLGGGGMPYRTRGEHPISEVRRGPPDREFCGFPAFRTHPDGAGFKDRPAWAGAERSAWSRPPIARAPPAKPRPDAAPSGSRDPQKPRIVTPEELQISNFNEERAQQRQQAHQQLAAPRLQPLADDRKAPTAARETVTNMMGQAQFHEDDHVESNAPNPSTLVAFVQRRPKHRHESTHLTSSAKHACESACICESCDGRFCVSSERLPPPVISAPTSYFEAFVKASV
jgi:hypothetical protein